MAKDFFYPAPPGSDVKVIKYPKGQEPRVCLTADKDHEIVGLLIEEGPEQSLVRWPNGNENCFSNDWFVKLEGPQLLKIKNVGVGAAAPLASANTSGEGKKVRAPSMNGASDTGSPSPPRVKKEPDDIAKKLQQFTGTPDLKAFAVDNGLWDAKYDAFGFGLQRMNVGNRLRNKLKKEPAYKVKW